MSRKLVRAFCWCNVKIKNRKRPADAEEYRKLIRWARKARGKNPKAFDALTEWVLDDAQWGGEKLAKNEKFLIHGVLARFKEQNARLRASLKALEPSGAVNPAVFKALDRFDEELSGQTGDERLRETVAGVFADFSAMQARGVREVIAGNVTGAHGTKGVDFLGYINYLKDCDAGVQWTLFMPDMVKRQQDGFKVDSFEYRKMPAMRFIGRESCEGDGLDKPEALQALFGALDAMEEYKSGFDYDVLFQHHFGRAVDIEPWHGFWGRLMKADAPVPEGFVSFDFVPQRDQNDFPDGPPFFSQFAYATFSGDMEASHKSEGYDSDAMYDVTRNIILGQGVPIPYPEKYWTAEVFPEGCEKHSMAYMFSAEP